MNCKIWAPFTGLLVLFALQLGCGGSNSGAPISKPSTPDSTITGVTVVATPSTITTTQTSTCAATVKGTGTFSTAVTWTATGGAITQNGVFTPSGAGSGTCKATSAQTGYGSVSGSADITITKPVTSPEGVYSGATSLGSTFEALVLPDSSFWALYGTTNNNIFFVQGVMQGNGSYSGTNYSASGWDYYYLDPMYLYAFTVNATFVPGSSITGTVNEPATVGTSSFTATTMPTGSFNYYATPHLSDIAGSWSGSLLGNVPANATIQSNGSFAGLSQGCNFSGSITPDASGHNFFEVTITYGSGTCSFPGVTQTGIAVDYLLSDGRTRQLVAAVHDSGHGNNVFIANR